MAGLWCLVLVILPLFGGVVSQQFEMEPVGAIVAKGQSLYTLECRAVGLAGADQTISYRLGSTVFSDDGFLRSDALGDLGLSSNDFLLNIVSNVDRTQRTVQLFVRNIGPRQAGDYQCLVCTAVDLLCDESSIALVSQVATLQIARLPVPSVPTCSGTTQVYLGDSVTLTCEAGSAVPAVELTWQRNGQPVPSTSVTHDDVRSRATKTLTAENDVDDAAFTCHLNYTHQSDVVSEMCSLPPLNVVSTPEVSVTASESISVDGEAVFTCVISSSTSTFAGDATAWTGLDAIEESRYSVSVSGQGSMLTVDPVQSGDHGTSLTCSATDEDGISASASVQLLIEGRPPPVTQGPTTPVPPTSEPDPPLGAIIAGVIGGLILLVLLCSLVLWYCRRRNRLMALAKKQAGLKAAQIPMTNHHAPAMPDKTANHAGYAPPDGKDYPDRLEDGLGNPDVVPREKREGPPDGVDPRKWWRETMPPTEDEHYEHKLGSNDYPTIKGMKMPFRDRSSPNPGSNPGSDRGYQPYDTRNAGDPRYEDLQVQRPDDYDYDNEAYERSYNSHLDQPDPYNDQYGDGYNDQYDNPPRDQYDDRPHEQYDDQYNDQPYDQYSDRPNEHYNDRYDDGQNDQYNDHPAVPYEDLHSAQPDDRYNDQYDDRYESYGRPDGQEEYSNAPDAGDDYYPRYDQDERIPDGHSSSTDQYPATPYDDSSYKPSYLDHLSDPHGYSQGYPDKPAFDDSLRDSQGTPSYV